MTVLSHVGLCVTDLDRSRRFYEDVFGFAFTGELVAPEEATARLLGIPPPVNLVAVYLRHGGTTLELLHYDRPDNPSARTRVLNEPGLTHLSFRVEDLSGVVDRVEGAGGSVVADSDIGVATFVRDPDGQLIELIGGSA